MLRFDKHTSRDTLVELGLKRVIAFCKKNGVKPPAIRLRTTGQPQFAACAYYVPSAKTMFVYPHLCARIGHGGMAWSYPGYVTDRTPFGVLAHELGHHFERGTLAAQWRKQTGEEPITSYAPNAHEWFAEMFRLYVTNPNLLKAIRPRTYQLMRREWPARCEGRSWQAVLAGAPARTLAQARHKVAVAKTAQKTKLAPLDRRSHRS